jgi:mono/diheme cytochrome c family protein
MGKALIGFLLGLMLLPAIAAAVAFTGRFPIQAEPQPPMWERRIANMALDPAIEKAAEGLTNPMPSPSDDDLVKGMKIYRDDCAVCHGDYKKPSSWGRNGLYPRAPGLADRGDHDPVPEIYVFVRDGVRYTGMGAWKGEMPDSDLWRVSNFLSKLKTLPPAVDSLWKASPPV